MKIKSPSPGKATVPYCYVVGAISDPFWMFVKKYHSNIITLVTPTQFAHILPKVPIFHF
jgi:hypothetical protein